MAAAILWLWSGPAYLEASSQKEVLILWGGRTDLPSNLIVNQTIRSILFRELGSEVDVRFEYIEEDAEDQQAALRQYLRVKYARRRFDLVIPVAGSAARFVRSYGRELYPGVPIVCWGGREEMASWGSGPPFTGAMGVLDVGRTVEFILQLQPATRRIVFVSGASAYDNVGLRGRRRDEMRRYEDRIAVTYLVGLSLEDLRTQVSSLPPDTAILYSGIFGDGAGRRLVSVDVLAELARVANAPVYGTSTAQLGTGIVGGVLVSQQAMSEAAAELAVRVLRGARVEDLRVVESPPVPMVDWRQLRRWGIPEDRLPPGTTVLYRERSLFETYRWRILGVLALCVAQAMLIGALLAQRARRRRADLERRRAEEVAEQHRRELAHLGRVTLLGELSGALAHELSQPLTAILANAQAARRLLALHPQKLAEVIESIDEIVESDKRAGEIIQRLRAMLTRGESQWQLVDLNEVAREVLDLARGDLLMRNVTLLTELDPTVPAVSGDRVQLQQVLLNLILNGCDAMAETPLPERHLKVVTRAESDGRVQLLVDDRGPGIPASDLDRIFEPFFTSKPQGLGLGLAICRTIVSAHGGRLWATNNPEGGATLHVALPGTAQTVVA